MADTTYAQSTFSAVTNHIEQFEQQQAQQQSSTENNEGAAPASNIEQNTNQEQNNAAAPTNGEQNQEQQPDLSTSSFSLPADEQDNQQQQQAQQPQFNWKEELKKLNKDEIIAELGIDPFAVEIDKHIKSGGQAIDYLNARAVDYNKISDEQLLKEEIKKEYPNLKPSQIDLMYKRKYEIPEDASDEDREFVTAQMEADAYKVRQSRIAEQQKFKISETPIPQKDEAYEQWKQQQQSQSQLMDQLRNYYESHPATKNLNESKRVTISLGEGVAPFNFALDRPEVLTKAMTDGGVTLNKLLTTQQGELDVAKQQLITLFAFDPQKFINDIFKYGQSTGVRKELVEEGQNAQRPQAKIAQLDTNQKPTYGVGKFGDKAR